MEACDPLPVFGVILRATPEESSKQVVGGRLLMDSSHSLRMTKLGHDHNPPPVNVV